MTPARGDAWSILFILLLSCVGCKQGDPPPPPPTLLTMEVAVPHFSATQSPSAAVTLPDVVVAPVYEAVRFRGTFDGELATPVIVEVTSSSQDQRMVFASGVGMPESQNGTSEYEVLIDNLPPPGPYRLHIFATPTDDFASGQIEFKAAPK